MFANYYTPPQIVGRPLKYRTNSKGKKHFWGVKGKNYGFYTSPQEQYMSRNQHSQSRRRIKTQNYDYEDNTYRYYDKYSSKKTMPFQNYQDSMENIHKKLEKKHITTGVQCDNPEEGFNIKEKLQICKEKLNKMRQEFKRRSEDEKNQKLPQIYQRGRSFHTRKDSLDQQKERRIPKFSSLEKDYQSIPKQRIVQIKRRDRTNNPTFCNSIAYPLPCYRYLT